MTKRNDKGGKAASLVIGGLVLAGLALPFGILSYVLYFAWDDQQSGEFYKPAEIDGRLYEVNIHGSSLAFDRGESEDHLYVNSASVLEDLIALGYRDYDAGQTENPYFAGKIAFRKSKYSESETKYRNPKDSYQIYKFYDQNRNQIFVYEPQTESEFVRRLRPTFPAFAKRKYGIGAKRDYLDATKILKAKLGRNLRFRVDEANKLLVIRVE